jgi:hypothetical protein
MLTLLPILTAWCMPQTETLQQVAVVPPQLLETTVVCLKHPPISQQIMMLLGDLLECFMKLVLF